jgi:transposase
MRARRKNRKFDETFRREAVALVLRGDRPLTEVARSLGVAQGTLWNWYDNEMVKKGKKPGRSPVPRPKDPDKETPEEKISRLERENEALRQKNEALEMDKAILKKAAAFFAKESE